MRSFPELAVVHIPVASMIREHGLEWTREGRSSGESILSPASHLKLARHNYNDVR